MLSTVLKSQHPDWSQLDAATQAKLVQDLKHQTETLRLAGMKSHWITCNMIYFIIIYYDVISHMDNIGIRLILIWSNYIWVILLNLVHSKFSVLRYFSQFIWVFAQSL